MVVLNCLMDCDPGVDDALALILALGHPNTRLLAITTVAGNARLEACTRNALRVLEAASPQPAPPVHEGAAAPIGGNARERALHVHGEDGLGDLAPTVYPEPADGPVPPSASEAILQYADGSLGEVTLVATGPLTNLALAARENPERLHLFREIVGGAVRVPGNVTPHAEFNIWSDPEALAILLALGVSLLLVPLDVTMQVVLTPDHLERLPPQNPRARLVLDCTRGYMAFHNKTRGVDGCFLHDPLALGVAIDSSFVEMEEVYLDVATSESEMRGKTFETSPDRGHPARICTGVDADRFLDFFLDRISV